MLRKPILLLLLPAVLSGCETLRFWEDSEAERLAAGGASLEMTGELIDRDGFALEVPVVIAADRKSATIDIDGGTQALAWSGEKASCPCRTYVSDAYVLQVRFPGSKDDGEAAVSRMSQGAEPLAVEGLIEEDDGLEVRVTLIVADDKQSVSFHDQGEVEVLTWDRKETAGCNCRAFLNEGFQATVFFPTDDQDGSAKLKRRRTSS